ncbi:hypothetical protein D081_0333 [Anaerovibrio sp. JC8]|uniref:hypothetical protein n=1 Tax=Anaerovibrio sp. JC8 TaxID=1240085 RepID=UPI000A0CA94E|nr:hypothetical protein [Anaerovibrio sp. JC8]ORU00885.1 hypothetical protein D081_0333 [Anaerovibrio sp. JC8]
MEENNNQQLIDMAHGMQEDIKMKMLEMVQQAASPYDILYEIANYLEAVSAERGYAQHIIDNIHTIYGIALKDKKPLEDEIKDLKDRAARIQESLDSGKFSEEENARMDFAIKAHQRKINQLKDML